MAKKVLAGFVLAWLSILLTACSGGGSVDEQERLERALNYWQSGDVRAAVIDLKSILQQNPLNSDARFWMGKIHVRLGYGADAEKELRQALNAGGVREEILPYLGRALLLQNRGDLLLEETLVANLPEKPVLSALRGEAYLMVGEVEDARASIRQALRVAPENIEVLLGAVKLALADKKIVEASTYLDKVLELDNKNSHAWFLKGGVDFMSGRLASAEAAFQQAIKHEPANVTTSLLFLANASLARTHLAQGKFQDALSRVDDVLLKIAPAHPLPNYLRALASYQLGNYEAAEGALLKVLKVAPNDSGSKLLLGAVSYYQGKFEQANAYLVNFIAVMPDYIPARKLLAATRIKLQQLEGAMEVLKPVLAQTPDDVQLLEMIGGVALQLGDSSGAKKYLSHALKKSPESVDVRMKLASVHLVEGNPDLAIRELDWEGEEDSALKGELVLAAAYMQKDEFGKARTLINAAVDKEPNSIPAHQLLAQLSLMEGDEAKAFVHFKRVLELQPRNVNLMLLLANKEEKDGDEDVARELLEKVLMMEPGQVEAVVKLTYLEARAGRWDEAFTLARSLSGEKVGAGGRFELEGNLFMLRNDYENAFKSYDQAVKVSSSEPLVLKRYQAHKQLDNNAAIVLLERWIERHPANFRVRMLLATEYMNHSRNAEAKAHFESILKEQPRNPAALNNLAWLYTEEKDRYAIDIAKKAYEIRPNSAAILDTYGWALVQFGDKKMGLELLEASFEKAPEDATIRHHLQVARQLVR